jgi:hypothetical protein
MWTGGREGGREGGMGGREGGMVRVLLLHKDEVGLVGMVLGHVD